MEPNKNQEEVEIDLIKLFQMMWDRKKVVGGIIFFCTALAIIIAFLLPKQWESTALVQTRSAGKNLGGAAAMAAAMGINMGGSAGDSPTNYIELMKTRRVLEPIIDQLEWGEPGDDPEEVAKLKPDAKKFAEKNLEIQNTMQTNLISVTAKGRTPEEAQFIAQSVVENFLVMQTEVNQLTQSLLVKFLSSRIDEALKESDEAAQRLADYSKENKMYSPDEQAKEAISLLAAYDKAIGDREVARLAAQAEYDTATAKLGEQRASAKTYNVADNATIQSIRSQIVAKEVALVGLKQKYTEEHPDVAAAQKELEGLNSALVAEVNAAVDSGAASLNTAQIELVKSQAIAEAQMGAAAASEEAIKEKLAEKEAEMESFPETVMKYLQLQRDAGIKQGVYTTLVQQREQSKIQEAMESMDIQIIDGANLPDEEKPASPKKKQIAGIGLAIGCLLAFGYGFLLYYRQEIWHG